MKSSQASSALFIASTQSCILHYYHRRSQYHQYHHDHHYNGDHHTNADHDDHDGHLGSGSVLASLLGRDQLQKATPPMLLPLHLPLLFHHHLHIYLFFCLFSFCNCINVFISMLVSLFDSAKCRIFQSGEKETNLILHKMCTFTKSV